MYMFETLTESFERNEKAQNVNQVKKYNCRFVVAQYTEAETAELCENTLMMSSLAYIR